MFESELRDEQRSMQKLTAEIRQISFRYESRLHELKRKFDRVNGSAEKQIESLISEFQSEIDSVLKDFERKIDKDLSTQIDSVAQQEATALKFLQDYKTQCEKSYLQAAKSLVVIKGEL